MRGVFWVFILFAMSIPIVACDGGSTVHRPVGASDPDVTGDADTIIGAEDAATGDADGEITPGSDDPAQSDTVVSDEELPDDAESAVDTFGFSDLAEPVDDSILPDTAVAPDTEPYPDNTVSSDSFVPADEDTLVSDADVVSCAADTDCAFGKKCDTALTPAQCVAASTCETDMDCAVYQKCAITTNWKECQLNSSPTTCTADTDCAAGESCASVFTGYSVCRSNNECTADTECAANEKCIWSGTNYVCQLICTVDTDCGFGYRCVAGDPNTCEYANECGSDADCDNLKVCQASSSDNWMVCTLALGTVCTSDDACDIAYYCDLSLGVIGSCKSRSQCQIDADCTGGTVCQNNGTYNECVAVSSQSCLLDIQCPTDWSCVSGTCTPSYAGTCPEIEGEWTTWISTSLLFTQGTVYEFIPESGCSGSIKASGAAISSGTFAQTSTANYDLKMALLFDCTAQITLNTIMNVTCSNGTATLAKK